MHPDEIFTHGPSALVTHLTAALYPMFPKIMNLHVYDSHVKTRSHFKAFVFLSHFSFLYIQPGYAGMYHVGVNKKERLKY
jgi:hypothetical protein